jgi:hypothetical protein
MAKIVIGSPSLTQPVLLYPGFRPTMLQQHRWNSILVPITLEYKYHNLILSGESLEASTHQSSLPLSAQDQATLPLTQLKIS